MVMEVLNMYAFILKIAFSHYTLTTMVNNIVKISAGGVNVMTCQ